MSNAVSSLHTLDNPFIELTDDDFDFAEQQGADDNEPVDLSRVIPSVAIAQVVQTPTGEEIVTDGWDDELTQVMRADEIKQLQAETDPQRYKTLRAMAAVAQNVLQRVL